MRIIKSLAKMVLTTLLLLLAATLLPMVGEGVEELILWRRLGSIPNGTSKRTLLESRINEIRCRRQVFTETLFETEGEPHEKSQ